MKLYHYSTFENFPSIRREGLKIGGDGFVYLADSHELARAFAYLYGLQAYALFEVDIEPNEISESTDHNEEYFKGLTQKNKRKMLYKRAQYTSRQSEIYRYVFGVKETDHDR
ncbi:hypothetical protein [Streptococcus thermophilus]|uniref:hypothetical protein n=1 Tax=Streptococcus thermophilus TaxID=1308 RepID=UPI0021E576DC|nr:hypothetical protein [Streptococcus thermophilus]UYI02465.1 hypothetical protein ST4067_08640 [Streptococcus thermophilus]